VDIEKTNLGIRKAGLELKATMTCLSKRFNGLMRLKLLGRRIELCQIAQQF